MTPPTARDVLVGVAPYGQLGHNLPGSNNYFDCGGRQRSRGMRVSGRAPAGPSPARVPEQGRAATRRGPDAGGRAAARSHALTFSARPCARRCHRRRNPRQCGQGFGHGLAFAVWCRCASFACLSVPDTAGNRAPRLASSVLVQYPFVARSVLAVHKVTSRLRDEERDNGRHPGRLAADHTSAPSIHVRST